MPATGQGAGAAKMSTKDQVLVAGLPGDDQPDVHVARLELEDLAGAAPVLVLRAATLREGGGVALGETRLVPLSGAKEVKAVGGGEIALHGSSGRVLARLFLETTEDERNWMSAIKRGIEIASKSSQDQGESASVEEDGEDEIATLKARSQKLQSRIADLEAVGERRDKHLHKMLKRVDGAMKMLGAVQSMCDQQRKVIDAQRVAISSLREDCGLPPDGDEVTAPGNGADEERQQVEEKEDAEAEEEEEDGEDEDAEEVRALEAELSAKTASMEAMLQQLMSMQSALAAIQASSAQGEQSAADDDDPAPVAANVRPSTAAPTFRGPASPGQSQAADDDEGTENEQVQSVLDQLQALEAEKAHYEDMLRNSQNEHEGLTSRLSDMRSLLTRLGMNPDDLEVNDEDE